MPRRLLPAILSCFVLLCFTVNANGQAGLAISGSVVDQSGGRLSGVVIDLVAQSREMTVTTDAEGRYQFENVPKGTAELTFRLLNFSVVRRTVNVGTESGALTDTVLALALNADVLVTASSTFRNIADVENPAENLVGIASAASQGAVTAAQLETRPIMRAGEVLETVPGLVVSQHSGEGKANQYYLRGFNLDHGTDFSMMVAGVPSNASSVFWTPAASEVAGAGPRSF